MLLWAEAKTTYKLLQYKSFPFNSLRERRSPSSGDTRSKREGASRKARKSRSGIEGEGKNSMIDWLRVPWIMGHSYLGLDR